DAEKQKPTIWSDHAPVDSFSPHGEAFSKDSGLTPSGSMALCRLKSTVAMYSMGSRSLLISKKRPLLPI
ncbi:hypothetical protein, partial [Klebsiella pneumoniae]